MEQFDHSKYQFEDFTVNEEMHKALLKIYVPLRLFLIDYINAKHEFTKLLSRLHTREDNEKNDLFSTLKNQIIYDVKSQEVNNKYKVIKRYLEAIDRVLLYRLKIVCANNTSDIFEDLGDKKSTEKIIKLSTSMIIDRYMNDSLSKYT